MLGQDLTDYVHPCDHQLLKQLLVKKQAGAEDEPVQVGDTQSGHDREAFIWVLFGKILDSVRRGGIQT